MKHIVVDLEMNCLAKEYKEEKQICCMETIEIGAVVLDENYREIGRFKTLVKPQFNDEIGKKYERLTGITTAMVANAPVFSEALAMFLSWCRSQNDEVRLYQWSESDLCQFRNEMLLKDIRVSPEDGSFLENWEDFQKEFGEKLGISRALALKDAVMYAGVDFQGRAHDALADAQVTAALLETIRTPEKCEKALAHVIEALKPSRKPMTLGDMFDFSELIMAS